MKISLNWLKKFVDIPENLSAKKLGELLTLHTAEVEGFEDQKKRFEKMVVGRTKNIHSHPNADKLKLVETEALGLDDIVFEIDNKSLTHRPDLWGHYGFARELSVILDKKLKPYTADTKFPSKGNTFKIYVKEPKVVPRFTACFISGITVEDSPDWLKQRLEAIDIPAINNIVDVTNYVMAELGQPMHAYDRKMVKTDTLEVRLANDNEEVETIDHKKYKLTSKDLIVTNGKKFLGIGGVMGGIDSEINKKTTELIIEAANWDPVVTRKTSQRLGLRSDASQRFEKSLDPSMCPLAVKKAAELILKLCPQAKISGPLVDINHWKPQKKTINLSLDRLNSKIGEKISGSFVQKTLEALGFNVKKGNPLRITIPSHRATKDVLIEDDLVEEIARIYGYKNIPASLPALPIIIPRDNRSRRLKHHARKILSYGLGFSEAYNYSFYGEKDLENCFLNKKEHVRLKNYLSEEQSHLRTSLLPNLLKNIRENLKHTNKFKLYEIGRIYKENDFMPNEKKMICGCVVAPSGEIFYKAKGALEAFLRSFMKGQRPYMSFSTGQRPDRKSLNNTTPSPCAHPAKYTKFSISNTALARVYELHPLIAKNYEIPAKIGVFEINFEVLIAQAEKLETKYKKLPRFPSTSFDVSVIVPQKTAVAEIEKIIKNIAPDLIANIKLFDIFTGQQIEMNKKALAFTITIQAPDRTLTDEEMTKIQQKTFQSLQKAGGEIRGL